MFIEICIYLMNLFVYMYMVRFFKMKFLICVYDLIFIVFFLVLNDKGVVWSLLFMLWYIYYVWVFSICVIINGVKMELL